MPPLFGSPQLPGGLFGPAPRRGRLARRCVPKRVTLPVSLVPRTIGGPHASAYREASWAKHPLAALGICNDVPFRKVGLIEALGPGRVRWVPQGARSLAQAPRTGRAGSRVAPCRPTLEEPTGSVVSFSRVVPGLHAKPIKPRRLHRRCAPRASSPDLRCAISSRVRRRSTSIEVAWLSETACWD